MTVDIPLSLGLVATVDDEDAERVLAAGPWCAFRDRYTAYAKRGSVRLHTVRSACAVRANAVP